MPGFLSCSRAVSACSTSAAVAFAGGLLFACNAESPKPVAQAAAAQQPKWMTEEPKRVEPSPAVKALLKDDPDLEKKLTPDEVKMALAAAQYEAPPPEPAAIPRMPGETEWSQLEKRAADKLAAQKRRLENTIVWVGPDGYYHAQMCEALYAYIYDQRLNIMRKSFFGRNVTLGSAVASQTPRHADCAAPSAQ